MIIAVRFWLTDGRFVEAERQELPNDATLDEVRDRVAASLRDPETKGLVPLVTVTSPNGQRNIIITANLARISVTEEPY